MKGLLRILSGVKEKGVVDLDTGTYSIGRDEAAEIRIDSRQVSRKHAQIVVDRHHVRLVDCGSANGTQVNGKPFTAGPLYEGDRIQVGDVVFEFHLKRATPIASMASADKDAFTVRKTKTVSKAGHAAVHALPLRIFLTGVITLTLVGLALVSGVSYRSLLRDRLSRESTKHASQLVRYLAEKNREDLRVGNELLLDADSIAKEKGVREASLINAKRRVIAPVSRVSQVENDPFVAEALAQTTDKIIPPSPLQPDGTLTFVHPIRAYNDKLGGYETLGVAKIVFAPKDYIGTLPEASRLIGAMVVLAALLGFAISWALSRLLVTPLSHLADTIHLWRMGQKTEIKRTPYAEWAPLYDAVRDVLEEKTP